jgi:hypothetical protein
MTRVDFLKEKAWDEAIMAAVGQDFSQAWGTTW